MENLLRFFWRRLGGRSAKLGWLLMRTQKAWVGLRTSLPEAKAGPRNSGRFLILSPDPHFVTASKGDEAMILCAAAEIVRRNPEAQVFATCTSSVGEANVGRLGLTPLRLESGDKLEDSLNAIVAFQPDMMVTVGADVLDGSNDANFSLYLVALTDLVARSGIPAIITGSSFSKDLHPAVANAFSLLTDEVLVQVRDPLSHARLTAASSVKAELVADIAFLLKGEAQPGACVDECRWVARQREAGRRVIGVNFHPLLLNLKDRDSLPKFTAAIGVWLDRFISQNDQLSIILIAHDFRDRAADSNVLDGVFAYLKKTHGDRVAYLSEEHTAKELKGFVGTLDGIISGRMHLTIAALGAGTPVLVVTYGDKFEGLLGYFDMGDEFVLKPADMYDTIKVVARAQAFVNDLDVARSKVIRHLPAVTKASQKNFLTLPGKA